MEFHHPVNGSEGRPPTAPSWQPGYQTADDMRDEWHEVHGWATSPPPEVLAEWAAVRQAEKDHVGRNASPRDVDEGNDFPPVVYLPCAEKVDDPHAARVDMRRVQDGRTALLAYSNLDQLRHCCGEHQAWTSSTNCSSSARSSC
ncbi:SAV_915 family protein [Mycobacterium sp. MS1601]|uniref:SAV_915 family protein n=1 Tax=Mycobacterium sp. MS1601 TaxID=1936029 RepID=UPI0018D323C4|nr:SAV_915 family protein [Mycobacterium sp. MS1601]